MADSPHPSCGKPLGFVGGVDVLGTLGLCARGMWVSSCLCGALKGGVACGRMPGIKGHSPCYLLHTQVTTSENLFCLALKLN